MARTKTSFRCTACGHQVPKWVGRCPECGDEVTPADEADCETLVMAETPSAEAVWTLEAERELKKVPFFVRGKARRNTERFAREQGIALITVETLYHAKAHFSS